MKRGVNATLWGVAEAFEHGKNAMKAVTWAE